MKKDLTQKQLWRLLEEQAASGSLGKSAPDETAVLHDDPDYVFAALRTGLAEDLHRAMQQSGLNENTLAKKLGITRQAVNEVFQMKTNMTLKSLARFCSALGLRPTIGLDAIPRPAKPRKQVPAAKATGKGKAAGNRKPVRRHRTPTASVKPQD
jgi:transcriptional regulator with XRE-family HTH domain